MHAQKRRLRSQIGAILVFLLVLSLSGCIPLNHDSQAKEDSATELADLTPELLLEEIQAAQSEADDTAKLYASAGGKFRRDLMRRYIDTGLQAADRLLAHSEANEQQAQAARHAKAMLLCRALNNGWDTYEDQLIAFHTQLDDEFPQTEATAVVDAVLLARKYIENGAEFEQTMEALKTHAETFRDHSTGPCLFHKYAERLRSEHRMSEAKLCCQEALSIYGRAPEAASVRQLLTQIAMEQRTSRAKQARLAQIKQRLGGHEDGYFVMFLRPHKLRKGSLVDYVVAVGQQDAIDYATNIRKGWMWELVAWYPKTPEGKRKAHAQCQRLIKENTYSGPIAPF